MITLTKINTSDPRYALVESLMTEAFPLDERRDTPQQLLYTDTNAAFSCCVIEADGQPVGLLNYWEFDGVCYVEHLAILPQLRGHGYGAEALTCLSGLTGLPTVLEVELPTDDISRRRIAFYRRQGFRLWDEVEYIQPPYRPGGNSVPMHLMSRGDIDQHRDSRRIMDALRSYVYNLK